ncbi:LPXTG cell wall anchor domain-containing protein [Micromonospora sp. AMSO31t]|uniref:LPXTG cell wall anchor domain-containing protein n=1 Tax=Micromonospora sp. AMSO31t TaxID=2650566 RepID=UPI00124B87D2|nr:LPXTG cell wall anchor domain-containing protein [Micromonospora sp. AMSO31t]KAB1910762.1 LPXTG cell wall anchor domain-containing protein [Micromonospora sp. AMSO31t]
MLTNSTRRWLAGLGVAGAFVAASATPAFAEESQAKLGIYFGDTTIATGSDGKIEYSTIHSSAPVVLHDLTIRYDFSDLAGKVTVGEEEDTGNDCTSPSQNVLVCTTPYEVEVDEWGVAGLSAVQIKATDKAQDGDVGTLKVTLTATGFDAVSHDAKVRVGEGVDLAAGPETAVSVAPGKSFTAPLKVSNAGKSTAKGAAVIFYNDYGLNAGKHYSNCTYVGDELRTCRFKDDLPSGSTVTASLPYVLGADSLAPGFKYGEIIWMTPDEFEDFQGYLEHYDATIGEPGTDGELTLAQAGGKATARGFQADPRPENNGTNLQVTVTGNNSTDLEALGASVTGKAGATVQATVGLRNNGPATLDYTRSGSSVTYLTLDVPKGTTAVTVPENCFPVNGDEWGEPGKPGAQHYRCYFDSFLKAGDSVNLDFALRIDKVIANATGLVKINVPCECDGGFYRDLKPANDTAKVVVNAAPGGEGGQGGGGEGDGGTLPITGSSTALIAGVGALLLAAGAAGYVVSRRRRTRFVA